MAEMTKIVNCSLIGVTIITIIIFSQLTTINCHQTTFREETENVDNIIDQESSHHPGDNLKGDNNQNNSSSFSIFHSLIPDWIRWRMDYIKSVIRQLRSQDISNLISEWMSLSTSEITGINIRSSLTCYDNLGCFPAERNCFALLFGVQNSVYSLEKINTTFIVFNRDNEAPKYIFYDNLNRDIKNVTLYSDVENLYSGSRVQFGIRGERMASRTQASGS